MTVEKTKINEKRPRMVHLKNEIKRFVGGSLNYF